MSGKFVGDAVKTEVIDVNQLGSGLELVRTRKIEFDHGEAEKILSHEEFPGDRQLKNRHVEYLVNAMRRGTFHPEWVNLVICRLDDKTFRMNGQHTAWARLEMPKGYSCLVSMLEYRAKEMDDVRILYASIDRSSPRTRANVITSYLAGTDEFEGVKARTIAVVPQGFALWFWKTSGERRRHDGDDVATLVRTDHYDLAKKVCTFLDNHSGREQKHILRAPVVAAIFATFNKAPQIAPEFWGPVADGTGIESKGDPRLKLRNELQRVAVDSGGGAQTDKKRVTQEFMFRQCIAAWNAFREGRSLQLLRAVESGNRPAVK